MISEKIRMLESSATMEVNRKSQELQAKGMPVINLSVGEPDFDTPEPIKNYAIEAIKSGFTRYTVAKGIPELREEICGKLKEENGLVYGSEQIVVSNGAKHSLFNVFLALIEPGDEVIIPAPYWVSYPAMVKIAGGVPVLCRWDENFKIDMDHLKSLITKKTKALVLNSPSNPTGIVYNKTELEQLASIIVEKGIVCISDEVYEKIIYDDKQHISIASFSPEIKKLTVVVNAVSKSFSMTGWRIGYLAAEDGIAAAVAKVQGQTSSAPCSISQKAAYFAIREGIGLVEPMIREFGKRREYLLNNLPSDFSYPVPMGAFYLFFRYKDMDSVSLSGTLLEKKFLAVVPGQDFGADKYVRMSYATGMGNIRESVKRLKEAVEEGILK